MGALTIGVVTKPFPFEGSLRMKNAEIGISELGISRRPDYYSNQRLLEVADENMPVIEAFKLSDSV